MKYVFVLFLLGQFVLPSTGRANDAADLTAFIQKNAVTLLKVDANQDFPHADELDRLIGHKRIIYLGEPDHYVSEKYDFRLMLIRHLVKRGFTHIGMEMGRSDGKKVDRFLQTGATPDLQLCMYQKTRCTRVDRDDIPVGRLETADPEGRANFIGEDFWFYQQLARVAPLGRLHYFGFDVDLPAGGAYADVRAELEPYAAESLVTELLSRLARVPNETLAEEKLRLSRLLDFLHDKTTALSKVLGAERFKEVFASVLTLRNSFAFIQVAFNNPSQDELHAAYEEREKFVMFRALREQIEKLPAGEGIILMGHNMHLSKSSKSLSFGSLEHPYEKLWYTIGSFLADTYVNQVFSIWMMYNEGYHWDLKCEGVACPVSSDPGRVESLFAEAEGGSSFWLPTAIENSSAKYLSQPHNFNQNGQDGSGILQDQADAIFFVNDVTAPYPR